MCNLLRRNILIKQTWTEHDNNHVQWPWLKHNTSSIISSWCQHTILNLFNPSICPHWFLQFCTTTWLSENVLWKMITNFLQLKSRVYIRNFDSKAEYNRRSISAYTYKESRLLNKLGATLILLLNGLFSLVSLTKMIWYWTVTIVKHNSFDFLILIKLAYFFL
jgi:hypothetical protein